MKTTPYFVIGYIASGFLSLIGLLGIIFHGYFPLNLLSVKYQGQGIEIQTTSLAVVLLFGGILMFLWTIREHRESEKIKSIQDQYNNIYLSTLKQIMNSSTSPTKEEK